MIYVKVIFPDDQFTMFSAQRVNRDSETSEPPGHLVTFTLPPGEGAFESYDLHDVLSIYLMSETGKTLHKVCGMVREGVGFKQPVGTPMGDRPEPFAGRPEDEGPATVVPT